MVKFGDILNFWFREINPRCWWKKDQKFDDLVKSRFGEIHNKAVQCELFEWRGSPQGRLAEILVLDQFSRNIFRNHARAFSADPVALALAQEAVSLGVDKELTGVEKSFLYMPYMHSESGEIHEVAVKLFSQSGLENNFKFELKHKKIIDKFGRYPHRNVLLGRVSTEAEIEFLQTPGSSF